MMKTFNSIFNEAISIGNAKRFSLTRKTSGAYGNPTLDKVFGGRDRLVFPITLEKPISFNGHPLAVTIKYNIEMNDMAMSMEDYIKGVAYMKSDTDRKQPMRIGKILSKMERPDLVEAFKSDPLRSTKLDDYRVVISRHPYDIAGMSTDRNWTSCMNLGVKPVVYKDRQHGIGSNSRYVKEDVKAGSVIAYLVSSKDVHENGKLAVRRPISRILMKPHYNTTSATKMAWSLGKSYGAHRSEFVDFVEGWLRSEVNTGAENGVFMLKKTLYNDDEKGVNFLTKTPTTNDSVDAFFTEINYWNEKHQNRFAVVFDGEDGQSQTCVFTITIPIPESLYTITENRNFCPTEIPKIISELVGKLALSKPHHQLRRHMESLFFRQLTNTVELEYELVETSTESEVWAEIWAERFQNHRLDEYRYEDDVKTVNEFFKDFSPREQSERKIGYEELEKQIEENPEIGKLQSELKKALESVKLDTVRVEDDLKTITDLSISDVNNLISSKSHRDRISSLNDVAKIHEALVKVVTSGIIEIPDIFDYIERVEIRGKLTMDDQYRDWKRRLTNATASARTRIIETADEENYNDWLMVINKFWGPKFLTGNRG